MEFNAELHVCDSRGFRRNSRLSERSIDVDQNELKQLVHHLPMERRTNIQAAQYVEVAIKAAKVYGTMPAARSLAIRGIPMETALRALTKPERRSSLLSNRRMRPRFHNVQDSDHPPGSAPNAS
jgi:hypothetical protein